MTRACVALNCSRKTTLRSELLTRRLSRLAVVAITGADFISAQRPAGGKRMQVFRAFCGIVFIAELASPAQAQTPAAQEQKPSIEELLQRVDALQRRAADGDKLINALKHRVDELEMREK